MLDFYIFRLRMSLAFLLMLLLLRRLILEGLGAAGAFGWACGLVFAFLGLFSLAPLFALALPIIACAIAVLSFFWLSSEENSFSQAREFFLKVFGAAGASHFFMAWMGLLITGTALSVPVLGWLFAASLIIGCIAAYAINDKNPGLWHSFVTQVLGAGGATNWLLGFLALLTLGAGATFAMPVLLAIPAVIVGLSAFTWYFENKEAVNTKCLSCFSWQTTGQPQIKSTAVSQVKSEILRPAVLTASL